MRLLKLISIAAAVALLAGCGGGGGTGGSGTITGRVVQSTTLLPVVGATVTAGTGGNDITDANGGFSFGAGALGAQTIMVQATGYENTSVSANIQAGDNDQGDIKLVVASATDPPDPGGPGTIGGTVTLAGQSSALGATVMLLSGSTVYESKTFQTASGAYLIWAPVGTYTLRVEKTGFVPLEQQVQITDLTSIFIVNVTLQK